MKSDKLITVVIPTKNRPVFLEKSVACFLGWRRFLDLVVVDDGSSKEFSERNEKITKGKCEYYKLNKSMGSSFARNFGFEKRINKFVWFFDDDDMVGSATIYSLISLLKTGLDEDVILLPMEIIRSSISERVVTPTKEKNNYDAYRKELHQVNTSCTVIKSDVFLESGKWDENLVAGQDTDLFLRLSLLSKYKCLETEPVKIYTDHEDRITVNKKKQHKAILQFLIKNWYLISWKRRASYIKSYIKTLPVLLKILNKENK